LSIFIFFSLFFTERAKKPIAQEKKVVDKPSSNNTTTSSNNNHIRQLSPAMQKVHAQMKQHQQQQHLKPLHSLPPQLQKILEHKKFEGKIPNLKRSLTPPAPSAKLTPSQISVGDSSIKYKPPLAWPLPQPTVEPKVPVAISRPAPLQSTVQLELEDIEPSIIYKPASKYIEIVFFIQ
jgi:hypothetical protein